MSSAWTWRYEPTSATGTAAPEFTNQSDAETWIGETWRDLRADGVLAVTLLADGEPVYGPMPLDA